MKETTIKIAEKFNCKYTLFEEGSSPDDLEQLYLEAFERGKKEGFYPAILVLDEYVIDWLENVVEKEEDFNREKIIAECADNGKELLAERDYSEDSDDEDFIGNETEGDEIHNFVSYISFNDDMVSDDTILLELPVKNPWEIIGYLPLGGWNECPSPDEMIAICKYWYEKYKAVPAVFTHDVMEFYAPEKLNGVDSLEAAREHYCFCPDRVFQGTETYRLSELAAGLENSERWYFWWD